MLYNTVSGTRNSQLCTQLHTKWSKFKKKWRKHFEKKDGKNEIDSTIYNNKWKKARARARTHTHTHTHTHSV